jgi:phage/plasmid-like protein (TIGR03299 family)
MGRRAAWHDLGIVTGEHFTWGELCASGMMNFGVEKRQLQSPSGKPVSSWGTFRTDNDEFLGNVGEDYPILHHSRGFEGIDYLIATQGGAHYETAGVLGVGEVVWGLADLALTLEVVPGDRHETYLLFSTSYNCTRSYEFRITRRRVVCENTLNFALASAAEAKLRIRHTKNAERRIVDMNEVIQDIRVQGASVKETLQQLAQRTTTRDTVESIFDRLYPKTKGDDGAEYSSAVRNNTLREILARFEGNDNNAFPDVRGTAYNLLNAITEYTDHARTARAGSRAESAMFGSGDRLKTKALDVITHFAQSMPAKSFPRTFAAPTWAAQQVNKAVIELEAPPAPPAPTQGSLLDQILAEVC